MSLYTDSYVLSNMQIVDFFNFSGVFLARHLILIKKGGLLQLKFGGVGVGVVVNIYLWARQPEKFFMYPSQICYACY